MCNMTVGMLEIAEVVMKGNMTALESVHLSVNQLSGEIPSSMSSLSFLIHLNLSCNSLRARMPTSTQLQSFDASSFAGNDLCGPPFTKNCSAGGVSRIVKYMTVKRGLQVVVWDSQSVLGV